jgi:hypothetical protein
VRGVGVKLELLSFPISRSMSVGRLPTKALICVILMDPLAIPRNMIGTSIQVLLKQPSKVLCPQYKFTTFYLNSKAPTRRLLFV